MRSGKRDLHGERQGSAIVAKPNDKDHEWQELGLVAEHQDGKQTMIRTVIAQA